MQVSSDMGRCESEKHNSLRVELHHGNVLLNALDKLDYYLMY